MPCHAEPRQKYCNKIRKTNCKIWIWCISLQWLISVAAEDSVAVYPKGDIFVRYGENLTIFCITGGDSTYRDLEFMLSGKTLKSEMLNDTTIKLFIERPSEDTWQRYYCSNRKTGGNVTNSVIVVSPPAKVKDFECVSKNLDALVCSWMSQESQDLIEFTSYFLTFVINGYKMKTCKGEALHGTLRRCTWSSNSAPGYRQQAETFECYLRATISYNGILMTNEEHFTIDHFSVVKLDPPMNLRILSKTPHSVELSWKITNNLDLLNGGVEHRIEYQIGNADNTLHFHRINTIDLPNNNRTYRFNITDLPYAYMQYEVRMSIKPVIAKNKIWSNFSTLMFYTSSERPYRPPKIAAGAFRQNDYTEDRVVHIYWEQLEEHEEAGDNFTYKIVVKQGIDIQTLFPESKSRGLLVLNNASLGAMDVSVWSFNDKGSSVNRSNLYIPSKTHTNSLKVASFSIFEENSTSDEHTTYELSWKEIDNIDNYTIFWCQDSTTQNICKSRIRFEVLSDNNNWKNKHVINLPKNHTYRFAISANAGERSSGMTWAKCVISKDENILPIHFEEDAILVDKTSVELRWAMNCILKEGIVNGYEVTYLSIADSNMIPTRVNITNITQTKLTIKALKPYTTYEFIIELNTSYGLKGNENNKINITTLEDTPTIPRNIQIYNVTNNSLEISWASPLSINGDENRTIYVITNYGNKIKTVEYENKNTKLDKLNSFTNYSLSVKACNMKIGSCSDATDATVVRTAIGPPSAPINFTLNDKLLTWEPPQYPGGNVQLYEIKVAEDQNENNLVTFNISRFKYDVTICDEKKVGNVKYQVRAINFDDHNFHGAASSSKNVTLGKRAQGDNQIIKYPGEWSNEVPVNCTSITNLNWIYFIIGVYLVLGAGIITFIFYKCIKKMKALPPPKFPLGTFDILEKYKFQKDSEVSTTEPTTSSVDDELNENPSKTDEHKYAQLQLLEDNTHPLPTISQLLKVITLDRITDKYMRNTVSHGSTTKEAAAAVLIPTMNDQGYCQMHYNPGVVAKAATLRPTMNTQGYCQMSYNPGATAEEAILRPDDDQGYCQMQNKPGVAADAAILRTTRKTQVSYNPGVTAEAAMLRPNMNTQGYCQVSYDSGATTDAAMLRLNMMTQGYCQVPYNPGATAKTATLRPKMSTQGYCQVPYNPSADAEAAMLRPTI